MEGLVHETEKMLGILKGNELRDAGLIASAQKLEHVRWRRTALRQPSPGNWIFATTSARCMRSWKTRDRQISC